MAASESLYPSLDTPCVLLDLDKLEADIKEMSSLAAEAGVHLRPHIKVHQSAFITKLQVEAGACGIEVGTIDQAEVFAAEGFDDIMVAHPFFGQLKMAKLKRLLGQRLEIIPTNPFIVTNMHDELYGVRNGEVEKIISMTGRGRGS